LPNFRIFGIYEQLGLEQYDGVMGLGLAKREHECSILSFLHRNGYIDSFMFSVYIGNKTGELSVL